MPPRGSDYFAGPLDGLRASVSGRAVILHEGPAPTLPVADQPRGSRAGLMVTLDLDGPQLARVPEALRQLRPEFRPGLTLQVTDRSPSRTPEQAESMANDLLGDLHPTAALQVPANRLAERPAPNPRVVPVDGSGNPTFTATAAAFRFHAETGNGVPVLSTPSPYGLTPGPRHGTYELTPGWFVDARSPDALWVGRHLPETVAPRRAAADGPVPILVGRAGELVPDEVMAQLGQIRAVAPPTEVGLLGQTLTGGQRQQLADVRAALPKGWQAHPVPVGWVVTAGRAAGADPGVAAIRASYPDSQVLFVDAAAGARSVAELVAALPEPLRGRVVVQPASGAAVSWQGIAELSGMLPARTTGVPAVVVPVVRLAELPPASAPGFVPMMWGPAGPVRTLPHFADHYRVYGSDATPGESLPAGLTAGDGTGRFGIDLPGLRGWVVDTTNPDMVHIAPRDVALQPTPSTGSARSDAIRVRVDGTPNQSQRAGLFTVLEGLRAGRPVEVSLAGEPDGMRALENAAVRENLPPGFTAHQLPAGHLVVRGADAATPAELAGARDVPPAPDVTLIQVGRDVPVGTILGSLPSGVRNRAVLRRGDDPLSAAWVPPHLRGRQWPSEHVVHQAERSRVIDAERTLAVQTATTRTWVAQATGQATVAPVVASPARAFQLDNLGHHDLAEHHLAAVQVEVGGNQMTSLLREVGPSLPPPVALRGGADASPSQHANAAILEAIRLLLADQPALAHEVVLQNRTALVGRQRLDWVRWLGELRDALPGRADDIDTLTEQVVTC
ncbi:hypothetical protein [Micromonospora sp. DT233]|uniref:hypothetical protein n=1 Tax=Micromonospora sp. DT233 TaxID=3393432 RepID=UPI003CF031D4